MTFEEHMVEVDRIFIKFTGMSYVDWPDWCYADDYEDGLSPLETFENWRLEYWVDGE